MISLTSSVVESRRAIPQKYTGEGELVGTYQR